MVYLFLAPGFEEVEAITPLDYLRRCEELEVCSVSILDTKVVTGSHGISVVADRTISEVTLDDADMIILPGGMPGTLQLEMSAPLQQLIDQAVAKELWIAAICAAPSILGHKGLLEGRRATCYLGFETQLTGATYTGAEVEVDGKFITARGAGVAAQFSFAIIEQLLGKARADKLKGAVLWED